MTLWGGMMFKPVCIIPARKGSKRLPRKNVIMCDGKPLIWYTIQVAKGSGMFDHIIVSTDDELACSIAREEGIDFWVRDKGLCVDTATVVDVCLDVLRFWSQYETFCVLLPTCPLRTVEDVRIACELFGGQVCDFVMSVTEYYYHPYQALFVDGYLLPSTPDMLSMQSQEWDKFYHHNGSIIFGHTESLRRYKSFYGGKVVPYLMPRERSVDIDTIDDLEYAEYLLKKSVAR